MQRLGNTIRTEGPYRIVEVVETYLDGTSKVDSYRIFGPNADSSWDYTLEQAHAYLDAKKK